VSLDAARLDKLNGNTLWMDALRKEMEAVWIAFEIQDAEVKHLPGYKKIPGHIIWDVKWISQGRLDTSLVAIALTLPKL